MRYCLTAGNLKFDVIPMPWQAQLSSYRDAVIVNANRDSLPDILLVGNYYENNIQMGRYDADFGTLLLNQGNGKFTAENLNGLADKGPGEAYPENQYCGEKILCSRQE